MNMRHSVKRTISKAAYTLLVTLLLLTLFGCVAAMASGDLIVSSDKTLSSKFNPHDNVTVKEGVTLTLADRTGDPVGLEIFKSLTVEEGGKITGGLLIIHREAEIKGMPLYYRYRGQICRIPDGMKLSRLGNADDDYNPNFTYDKKEGKFILDGEINGGDPFEIFISERHVTVILKKTHQLTLSGITEGVKWSSSDKTVAKVSKTGLVTAKKPGRVVITAKYNGKEYTAEVEVVKKGLSQSEMYMNPGMEFMLQLYGYKLKSVKSSDKTVATINKKLVVNAVGPGKCTLTVKTASGKKFKCTVQVDEKGELIEEQPEPADGKVELPEEQAGPVEGKAEPTEGQAGPVEK